MQVDYESLRREVITTVGLFYKCRTGSFHTLYFTKNLLKNIDIMLNVYSTNSYKTTPILLEVIARFKATGSFAKRYDVPDMTTFDTTPYIEFTYKSDKSGDPPICNDAIIAKGLLTKREIGYVEYITERVAFILKDFFAQCGGELIDFKIEFGRLPNGQIILIDEISPDTCRILDMKTGESLDKDRFRKNMGKVSEAYIEMAKRVSEVLDII